MPLEYRDVLDMYDELHDVGAVSESIEDWSTRMNQLTGSDMYSAGLHSNWIKRASVGIDRLLEKTGAPAATESLGRSIGGVFGQEEAGAAAGENIPRMLVNLAPMLIPGGGIAGGIAKGAATAALAGAETYTETDSPLAGLISGATFAALPGITGAAERLTLKALGKPLLQGPITNLAGEEIGRIAGRRFAETTTERLLSKAGGQVGAFGTLAASQPLTQLAAGQPVTSPLSPENLVSAGVSQLPFAALHLAGRFRGAAPQPRQSDIQAMLDLSQQRVEQRDAMKQKENQVPVEQMPDPEEVLPTVTPQQAAETERLISQIRGQQVKLSGDQSLTEEQRINQENLLSQQEAELTRTHRPTPDSVFGNKILPDEPRTNVIGRELKGNDYGSWRAIYVTNDPFNPEELRGRVIGYSTKGEPAPISGVQTMETGSTGPRGTFPGIQRFGLPDPQWWSFNKSPEEWSKRRPPKELGFGKTQEPMQVPTGSLLEAFPAQREMSREELSDHINELKLASDQARAAQSSADLQSATVRLSGTQEENNINPTNDASLKTTATRLVKAGVDEGEATKLAVAVEAKKTENRLSTREQERAAPLPTTKEIGELEEKMGGEGGFSIITADKLSHGKSEEVDVQPVSDISTEAAFQAVRQHEPTIRRAFDSWKGSKENVFGKDVADFVELVENMGSLKAAQADPERAAQILRDRKGTAVEPDDVLEFVNRPHVQEMANAHDRVLTDTQRTNEAPEQRPPPIPAGGKFVYSLGDYDPVTNVLNQKHKLPASGEVLAESFRHLAGVGKPLQKAEVDFYKGIVPEAFEGVKVNVPKLYEGLKTKGPQVEVHKMGEVSATDAEAQARFDSINREMRRVEHEVETRFPRFRMSAGVLTEETVPGQRHAYNRINDQQEREYQALPQELRDLHQRYLTTMHEGEALREETPFTGEGSYSAIAPKPEAQMPGYVEGLVRLPSTPGAPKFETPKYAGPHFGQEDRNVLAFYRGYEETLPSGEKAFHVIEVQSDWAQHVRDAAERTKRARERGAEFVPGTLGERLEQEAREAPPLLKLYENLALKAAVAHAKEIGATKLILSDAETAMMTEGHDQVQPPVGPPGSTWRVEVPPERFDEVQKAITTDYESTPRGEQVRYPGLVLDRENGIVYGENMLAGDAKRSTGNLAQDLGLTQKPPEGGLPQEKGMRLHYDQSMPSVLEKLTGQKGEPVDLGVHKGALESVDTESYANRAQAEARAREIGQAEPGAHVEVREHGMGYDIYVGTVKGSPVFNTVEGQPKTNVTGRSYDISRTPTELTLTEPARAPGTVGRGDAPVWLPQEQQDIETIQRLGIEQGGRAMATSLASSGHPFFGPLGADLLRNFPESLDRITGSMRDIESGAFVKTLPGQRYDIRFSPAVLRGNDAYQMFVQAHEIVHGLSLAELQNPTNATIRTGLDEFRNRLIDQLPPHLKKAVNEAIKTDWYGKWHRREVTFQDLVPNGSFSDHNVAYAMLNVDELLSQGLTNHDTRRFMQSVKTPGGGTWFSRFTNFVGQLLRMKEPIRGTAFEEFLGRTDELLGRGEFVSSFRNFSNKYYENLGMSDSFVRSYTQRAMATILDKSSTPTEMLAKLNFGAGGIRSPEWTMARRDVTKMFQERGDDAMVTHNALNEFGHEPSHRGLDDYAEAMMLGEIPHDALDILPEPAARYVAETAKDFQNVLGAVRAATLDENKGALNLADPMSLRGPVKELHAMLDRVTAQARMQGIAQRAVEGTVAIAPDGYYDKIVSAPEAAPSWATGETKEGWWDKLTRFAEPSTQWARRVPQVNEAIVKGRQLNSNTRKMADAARLAFGTDLATGQLNRDTVKATSKILGTLKLEKAADKWIYATQVAGEKTGKIIPLDKSHPEVQKAVSGLSSKEQDQVETIMQQRAISTQAVQANTLEKMLQIGATEGAKIALTDGKKVNHAVELSEGLLRAATVDRNDPAAAQQADIVIRNTQRELSPDTFIKLLQFTTNAAEKWKITQQFFADNPDYANAQRYGKFLLTFKDGKETILAGVMSDKEAKSIAKGKPYKLEPNRKDHDDMAPMFGPGAVKTVNRLRELEQREINMLRPFLTPDQLQRKIEASGIEQYATELTYAKGVPGLQPQPRGLTKGADRLPWLQNHFSWITKTSSYWSRQLLRKQGELALLDPEVASNEQLRSRLEKHFDNMLQSDPAAGQFMQRFVTTWFLGWHPASAIVNGTQPFVTHIAELTALTGKPFKSYKTVLSAFADVIHHGVTGKWRDPAVQYALDRAAKEGELDLSMHDDRAAQQETLAINQKQVMEGNRVQTTGQRLSTLAGNFSTTGLWMFRTVERINNMLGFIEGVNHYRESQPNLSRDELYAKARDFNASVNYGGGVAARPVGLYGTRGAFPRTASMLAGSMQNYVLGSTFQLARYIRAGYFRPEGLTPHEIYSARTAAVQMLATQLAAAGVLGLPFVSSALAVLDKAFPDLETNRHLREWMNQLLGEDGENGHVLTDIAMTGVPSMSGWDMQSRLTMGNTVPGVSEINGFQPELLFGAPVNLISNFVKGGVKLASGDIEGIQSLMPSGLKKITQLMSDSGQVKDYRDRPIFTPTPSETAGIMLGFQPKRLSDYNAAQRISQLAQDNVTRRQGEFHQQMGAEVLKGNFGSVRQNLQRRLREDKTFDAPESVRAIARAAEELTFPRDLRREGTARSSEVRGRLLSTFGLPLNETSETGRLQFRHQVESRLGLPTTSSTDLRQAQLMDQLKLLHPDATRSELRRQVSLLSSGRRPRTLALQGE